jgi:hypothetical protein
MFIFVFVGFFFILLRALYFHSSHVAPSTIAKLATNNLLNLISDSFEIYRIASVWLVILWLALVALLINVILGLAYSWTAALTTLCTIFATLLLFKDIAKEIEMAKKNLPTVVKTDLNSSKL